MRTGIALALLAALAASPALAQNWPNETRLSTDAIGGAFSAFDSLSPLAPRRRELGEDRRERVMGWLGGVQEWVDERVDMIGERDREAQRYYDMRRSWDREWNVGR